MKSDSELSGERGLVGVTRVERTSEHRLPLILLLPLAGLLSGLITCALPMLPYFLGAVFGAIMAVCLGWSKILLDEKPYLLAVVAMVAFFVSVMVACGVEVFLPLPQDPRTPSPIALCAGGAVGAFLVVSYILFQLRREFSASGLVLRAVFGSICGGVLAVVGWAFTASVGVYVWHFLRILNVISSRSDPHGQLFYGETDLVYSLYVIWQAGMGLVLAAMLGSISQKRWLAKDLKT